MNRPGIIVDPQFCSPYYQPSVQQPITSVPYIAMLPENNARTGFVEDENFAQLVDAVGKDEAWLLLYLELAFTYGWRRSELLWLRVRQCNFRARTIRLEPGTTKNKEGREVAMTRNVAALLSLAVAGKRPDDFVLTRPNGGPVRDFRRSWWNLCVRAGLGTFTCRVCGRAVPEGGKCKAEDCGARRPAYSGLIPHDLRRSAAKALRAAGVPESVVMKIGGWQTRKMFERYAIVSSSDNRAAVESLESARARNENSNSNSDSRNLDGISRELEEEGGGRVQ